MSAAARKRAEPSARPSALEIFRVRAEARALLWQAGEIGLHEAVDELQAAAVASLVAEHGQDAVQAVMAQAFAAVRDDLASSSTLADDVWAAPGWRQAAIEYHPQRAGRTLVVEIDGRLDRLHRLMADDVSLERAWAEVSRPTGVAVSTLRAAEYLVQQNDVERFRTWLNQHSAAERTAIQKHLGRRACR